MDIGKQTRVEMDKYDTLQKIVDQLEYCNYEIDGRRLTNNIAFLRLKEMAKEQQHISDTPTLSAVPSEEKNDIMEQIYRILEDMEIDVGYDGPTIQGAEMKKTAENIYKLIERGIAG